MLYELLDINKKVFNLATPKSGSGAPSTNTEGIPGLIYIDTSSPDKKMYKCTEVSGNTYTWQEIKESVEIDKYKTAVLFTPQELSEEQKKQARDNIGVTGSGGALQKLTFTGASTEIYDGTKPVTVDIPTGGGGFSNKPLTKIVDYTLEGDAKSADFTSAKYPAIENCKELIVTLKHADGQTAPGLVRVLFDGETVGDSRLDKPKTVISFWFLGYTESWLWGATTSQNDSGVARPNVTPNMSYAITSGEYGPEKVWKPYKKVTVTAPLGTLATGDHIIIWGR